MSARLENSRPLGQLINVNQAGELDDGDDDGGGEQKDKLEVLKPQPTVEIGKKVCSKFNQSEA